MTSTIAEQVDHLSETMATQPPNEAMGAFAQEQAVSVPLPKNLDLCSPFGEDLYLLHEDFPDGLWMEEEECAIRTHPCKDRIAVFLVKSHQEREGIGFEALDEREAQEVCWPGRSVNHVASDL